MRQLMTNTAPRSSLRMLSSKTQKSRYDGSSPGTGGAQEPLSPEPFKLDSPYMATKLRNSNKVGGCISKHIHLI